MSENRGVVDRLFRLDQLDVHLSFVSFVCINFTFYISDEDIQRNWKSLDIWIQLDITMITLLQ